MKTVILAGAFALMAFQSALAHESAADTLHAFAAAAMQGDEQASQALLLSPADVAGLGDELAAYAALVQQGAGDFIAAFSDWKSVEEVVAIETSAMPGNDAVVMHVYLLRLQGDAGRTELPVAVLAVNDVFRVAPAARAPD